MNMTLRWYGPGYDTVSLEQIRQIPGVNGVITTLFGKQAGEIWTLEEVNNLKKIVNDAGLEIAGIESVNVSDDIKIGTEKRDEHIENYKLCDFRIVFGIFHYDLSHSIWTLYSVLVYLYCLNIRLPETFQAA